MDVGYNTFPPYITIVTMKVHENHQIQIERYKVLIFNKGLTCLLVDNNMVMLEGGMWNHACDDEDVCKCTPTLCD